MRIATVARKGILAKALNDRSLGFFAPRMPRFDVVLQRRELFAPLAIRDMQSEATL